ncbi:hypothetical protein BKA65DRAFT_584483 [Rhexocercosporidium sp. MPI-PUGE-AT-0058]|nr:hypothetical protein BKA65DRAFT_584483 [Rhexocercosporidium sp. MPI-PUGE-AT-0058]
MATAAKIATKPLNRTFTVPKPVGSFYTGRTAYLQELTSTLEHTTSPHQHTIQKRFVVEGLGGSGKTQFCCRFAELNREKFWGVFSINGASRETANQSFKTIAEIAGVALNERAAKSWLSSLSEDQSWLLIIDNVDDPDLEIDEFFPEGKRGFILITTRVRENIRHGNIGQKWFTFNTLEQDSAIELLLRRARIKEPWSESTKAFADTIAKALGYLPLGLVHAATAISKGLCRLYEYLGCFQDALARLRKESKKKGSVATDKSNDVYFGVYSSYELIYSRLEESRTEENQDAIELLKIFAFFDREDIRFDMLEAAAVNPGKEVEAEKRLKLEREESGATDSWTVFINELRFALRTEFLKDRSPPTLPTMLRQVMQNPSDDDMVLRDFKKWLRMALHVLQQWSLATHYEERDTYSVHPLIHDWVRSRPQMTLGEQAAWSQAAANTLEQSIILPNNGTPTLQEVELQRSCLLHLIYLRDRRREIIATINSNVRSRRPPRSLFPVVQATPDTVVKNQAQAKQSAKFSYIYFLCGRYSEAQILQEAVRDYLVPNLGLEHSLSMRSSIFLAKTYWLGGGRFNDAAVLTEDVFAAAKRELGGMHQTTLSVMDELGVIRKFQGRFLEAQELLQKAVEGRHVVCGPEHQDTLCSVDNLGSLYWTVFEWNKSKQQHTRALEGILKHPTMGPDHEKTILAKEHLAVIGEQYYEEAHEMMLDVVERRIRTMGKEAPWTLMALCNLAVTKHLLGNNNEAEDIIRKGLIIAERNLGVDHPGVLSAKRRLARVLTAQSKFEEAEKLYVYLLDRQHYQGGIRESGSVKGDQKDRIFTLYQFVEFWEAQKDYKQALAHCHDLCQILHTSIHPIAEMSRSKRDDLRRLGGISPSIEDP